MDKQIFIARRVGNGVVSVLVGFEAVDQNDAWKLANDGIDPLSGDWAEVRPANEREKSIFRAKQSNE